MITKENYLEEHIREIQLRSRKDPQLIERSLYALGLLEALSSTGMKFIFKGGSCLMLLLPHVMRLSTDNGANSKACPINPRSWQG